MDEARFGTHSKIGHGWFRTGTRSTVKVKLGFKNFYVYGAVEPATGNSFSLLLPKSNSECMNIFLQELARLYDKAIIILDRAGWHRSQQLIIPPNIQLLYLPPYSPEMNPVERLWQHLKKITIRNKIYESLEELEFAVCNSINLLDNNMISSLCAVNWYN